MTRRLAVLAAALVLSLAPTAPASAVTLVCINAATTDGGHTVSLKCTQGPGSFFRIRVKMRDSRGVLFEVSSPWRQYGLRASAHSDFGYYDVSYGIVVDTKAASS